MTSGVFFPDVKKWAAEEIAKKFPEIKIELLYFEPKHLIRLFDEVSKTLWWLESPCS